MKKSYEIFIWKKAPFLRLLIPVIFGILFQFYSKVPFSFIILFATIFISLFFIFSFLPEAMRFKFKAIQGFLTAGFLLLFGAFLTWQKDIRNHSNWYGNYTRQKSFIVATINEPPQEKAKSYKAIANADVIISNGKKRKTIGKFLIYLQKDSASKSLKYGDRIIVNKVLSPIRNSGNPAAFDYKQYCAFRQLYHQVYLKGNEWLLLKEKNSSWYKTIIFKTRSYILKTLDKYISGDDESSLAKALLIGYRVDLDKDLVQAYSNIGVVHLIAISGMHLALIYYFLVWLFARIPFIKKSKFTQLLFILLSLWFFALLTGSPASVLRSAVMFSFIAIGDSFEKKNSIYNSLAISAFVLLCYDPFILWDVGFQLSYMAVLGIVIFQKYIYNWFYFKNKIANEIWKIASVSLAAQLLALPLCIFYFHQFPLLFLLSNMIAIPLSTVALWGCITIVAVSSIPIAALYLGKLVWAVIWLLNHFVLLINSIPFSLWGGLSISVAGTILLYIISICFSYSFIKKNKLVLKIALAATFIFVSINAWSKWKTSKQKKIIVYNISQHRGIDFILGNQYHFVGDSDLTENSLLANYNIKPARIALMLDNNSDLKGILHVKKHVYQFYNKRILIVDSARNYSPLQKKINLDCIIISKNPRLTISELLKNFNCKNLVFDASNSFWKIDEWKKECEELHLHFHSVAEQGAFVINF